MEVTTLPHHIQKMVPKLLGMAKDVTTNGTYGNCKFILTEIKHREEKPYIQKRLNNKENDKKTPVTLPEILPVLQDMYENLHDINLYIYKSTKELTIIDIRYYLKSSLEENDRQQVINDPPMLHCKVSLPPWISGKDEKFDINWEHRPVLIRWKLFWWKLKRKIK